MHEIDSGKHRFRIIKFVGGAEAYMLYSCVQEGSDRELLLQIASKKEHNGTLDRLGFTLKELRRKADEAEAEYTEIKKDPNDFYNYHLGFPELIATFMHAVGWPDDRVNCSKRNPLRINILGFSNVDKVRDLKPLSKHLQVDRRRVDLRTSAWIFGKLLKLLDFAHGQQITVERLTPNNILIVPDQHYVIIFDWSKAKIHTGGIPAKTVRDEISECAKTIVIALGGNPETGIIPGSEEDGYVPYTNHLMHLVRNGGQNSRKTCNDFYEQINSLWERKFYPFCSHEIE